MTLLATVATIGLGATGAAAAEPGQPVNGLKFSIAADKLEAKAGDAITITLTFENASAEKLRVLQYGGPRWELVAPDAESLRPGPCLAADMAPPGLTSFPELDAGGKLSAPGQTIGGNPPSLYLPVNFMSYRIYLLKPGTYKLTAVYSNDMDKYWPGKAFNERVPVPGKVWKGEIRSNTLEVKFTGEFKAAPPPMSKPLWPPSGITPPQKGQAGAPPAAPAKNGNWSDLFAGEAWYKQQKGEEQTFTGTLEGVKPAGATTLMRNAQYRLGNRTLYTGAKRVPALDALVGRAVEIKGKAVDMELEGQSVREIWPAAVRPGGAAPAAPPAPRL
jgi:hypothetical protein